MSNKLLIIEEQFKDKECLHAMEDTGDGFVLLPIMGEDSAILNHNSLPEDITDFLDELLGILGEDNLANWETTIITVQSHSQPQREFLNVFFQYVPSIFELHRLESLLPEILLKIEKISFGKKVVVGFGQMRWQIAITENGQIIPPKSTQDDPDFILTISDISYALLADFSFTTNKKQIHEITTQLTNSTDEYKILQKKYIYLVNKYDQKCKLVNSYKNEQEIISKQQKERIEKRRNIIVAVETMNRIEWIKDNGQIIKPKQHLCRYNVKVDSSYSFGVNTQKKLIKAPSPGELYQIPSLRKHTVKKGEILFIIADPEDDPKELIIWTFKQKEWTNDQSTQKRIKTLLFPSRLQT